MSDMFFKRIRLINLIYTEGLLTGLTVKMLRIRFFLFNKFFYISLWLYPMGYSRSRGLSLRKTIRTLERK